MDISSTGTAAAAPERVWAVLSDVEAWPGWLPTVTRVERLDGAGGTGDRGTGGAGAVTVGSRFAVTQPRLGRAEWVVTSWQPGRAFAWESRRPGVRTTATHEVAPRGGGSVITLGIAWSGPGRLLVRTVFGRLTASYVQAELEALARTAGS